MIKHHQVGLDAAAAQVFAAFVATPRFGVELAVQVVHRYLGDVNAPAKRPANESAFLNRFLDSEFDRASRNRYVDRTTAHGRDAEALLGALR
jgi:hypothetical protein